MKGTRAEADRDLAVHSAGVLEVVTHVVADGGNILRSVRVAGRHLRDGLLGELLASLRCSLSARTTIEGVGERTASQLAIWPITFTAALTAASAAAVAAAVPKAVTIVATIARFCSTSELSERTARSVVSTPPVTGPTKSTSMAGIGEAAARVAAPRKARTLVETRIVILVKDKVFGEREKQELRERKSD